MLLLGGARARGAERLDERLKAGERVLFGRRQLVHLAAVGHEVTLLAGVGEERDGRLGVDQDQVLVTRQLHRSELGQIGQPLDWRHARAAFDPGREDLGQHGGAGGGRDLVRRGESALAQGAAAEQDRGRAAPSQHVRDLGDDLG